MNRELLSVVLLAIVGGLVYSALDAARYRATLRTLRSARPRTVPYPLVESTNGVSKQ